MITNRHGEPPLSRPPVARLGDHGESSGNLSDAPTIDPSTADVLFKPGAVYAAFQPIVELSSGAVVAYEALARFDPSTGFDNPGAAFAAVAHDPVRRARLDRICMVAAIEAALEAEFPNSVALFVNVLPTTLRHDTPAGLLAASTTAHQRMRIVTEITEVGVTARPAALVAFAARNRAQGGGLAIDDVGANRDSLSLLPLLRPDVIKLDRSIIADPPTPATGSTLGAVLSAAESTGAVVLAEGIETAAQQQLAMGLGATYGQGWHYGRPARLPSDITEPVRPLPFLDHAKDVVPAAPFDLIQDEDLQGRSAPYEYLLAVSLDLEAKAATLDAPILISTFQDAERFTPATAIRYTKLATTSSLVGAIAEGLDRRPAPNVRGGTIDAADPLRHDWNVVVLAPHFAAALIARDLTQSGPIADRRYDYIITHNQELVTLAARSLLARIIPRDD